MIPVRRIRTIQERARELGRIRLGYYEPKGRGRPAKLETFRFTSQSSELLAKVAELYGGTVQEWTPQGGKTKAWEVYSDSKRVPILLPPQAVNQAFEHWSGGGCQRRCDGERTVILDGKHSDAPCACSPEPDERLCKPTTRLNVVLRDVEGVGVWRLETHGYWAAVELPAVAEFLSRAQAQTYLPAHLILEQRTSKADGKTKEYMVPGIEVEGITPAQLVSGQTNVTAIDTPPPRQIEQSPARLDEDSIVAAAELATDLDELRFLWKEARNARVPQTVFDYLTERVEAVKAMDARFPEEPPVVDPVFGDRRDADAGPSRGDVDALWHSILMSVPESMTTSDVESDFHTVTGTDVAHASAEDMNTYLDHLAD